MKKIDCSQELTGRDECEFQAILRYIARFYIYKIKRRRNKEKEKILKRWRFFSCLILMINFKFRWEETQVQSTHRTAEVVKTKSREFFISNTHEYPLSLSNLLPLHVFSLLFLKQILKPKRDMRLLETSKGRSCGCYGSVYFELLKLGAYLYFKTNRYHINNSRCCREGEGLLLVSLCGIRSNRGFLWWKSTGQLQLDKTELIVLWWRLGANCSAMSAVWGEA